MTEAAANTPFNFFSFSAKKAIYRASEVCLQFGNQYVEPEHICFSLLLQRSCSAVQILQRLSVNLPKFTYHLEAALYERAGKFKDNPQFSPAALGLLDLSFRVSQKLRHREIGTTHLLLGLLQLDNPLLAGLFKEYGLDAARLRETFLAHLRGYRLPDIAAHAPAAAPLQWLPGASSTLTVGGASFTPERTFDTPALVPLADSLSDLLGRALAEWLKDCSGETYAAVQRVTPAHLLRALMDEPTDPLQSWIRDELATNTKFAAAIATWREASTKAHTQAQAPPEAAADDPAQA